MRMRKKKRAAERLCALSALFIENPGEYRGGELPFDKKRPLRLEIGCGKGDFICGLSEKEPEYNYLAMERVTDVVIIAAEKYAGCRGLGEMDFHGGWRAPDGKIYDGEPWDIPVSQRGNVRFMMMDAFGICDYFDGGIFESIYANFSDPWTKSGYASRRLTHPDYLKKYLRLLCPGGYFRFKTDNTELFDFSLESVEACDGFELLYHTRDLHNSERAADNVMTEYERNFSEKGININYLEARKK